MTERPHPPSPADEPAPAPPGPLRPAADPPTILGFRAEVVDDRDLDDDEDSDIVLVVLRRPDRFAAGLLVLAGVAAGVGLLLPWGPGAGAYGLSLVQQGLGVLGAGTGALAASGAWPPVAVVLTGGLLAVLGLLALVPARGHRLVGVLALLVASAAVASVVLLLARAGWRVERSQLGMWFAVAVPGLGLLGALKAMLTPPRVTVARR